VSAFDESFVEEGDDSVLDELHIAHSSSHWMRVVCNSVFFVLAVIIGFLVIHKEGEVLVKLYSLRHTSARFNQLNQTQTLSSTSISSASSSTSNRNSNHLGH
jgi:hypothetical protein